MLQNVVQVYRIDLEITQRNECMSRLRYGLRKLTIFVENGHFGQGSGKIGNFVEIVTLCYDKVTSFSNF